MPKPLRRARTDTFEHTISGLLTKRSNLSAEATELRDRLAQIRVDLEALDRVLRCLDYAGDLDAAMPPKRREAIFGRGELSRGILDVLRDATGPMRTREIAQRVVSGLGPESAGRAVLPTEMRCVSKALNHLKASGVVCGSDDVRGTRLWRVMNV